MENEEVALKSKILKAIGMSDEAEVMALKGQVADLESKIDSMQTEFSEALKSMQEEFKQTLTEALKPVEEVEVVAEKADTEPTEEEEPEVEVEEEDVEEEPEADKAEEVVEEPVAEKGESKQEPVHDNLTAEKSKPKSVYELMGRYPNGVKIRK